MVEIFRDRWVSGQATPVLAIIGDEWRGCGYERWNLPPNAFFLGKVSEEELIHLYNQCLLFVYPSLMEGFGLPVLEAMGCGAPVLAMRASSIPEVAGDAAMLADPDVPGALADCLDKLLNDRLLRVDLAARGRERAAGFSWGKTVAETMAVYRLAMGQG